MSQEQYKRLCCDEQIAGYCLHACRFAEEEDGEKDGDYDAEFVDGGDFRHVAELQGFEIEKPGQQRGEDEEQECRAADFLYALHRVGEEDYASGEHQYDAHVDRGGRRMQPTFMATMLYLGAGIGMGSESRLNAAYAQEIGDNIAYALTDDFNSLLANADNAFEKEIALLDARRDVRRDLNLGASTASRTVNRELGRSALEEYKRLPS